MGEDSQPDRATLDLSISPLPLRRQMEEKLRRAIIQGYFPPGAHLSDKMLCETFGVSRPIVREAIRLLEAEGLVETIPHRGSFVKKMSAEDAEHFHSVRGVLEALAAKRFAELATDEEISRLAETVERIREIPNDADGEKILAHKQRFYAILFEGARNPYLSEMLTQMLNRNMLLRATSLSKPGRQAAALAELDQLLEAIRRRDSEAAWTASLQHASAAADAAISILKERDSSNKAFRFVSKVAFIGVRRPPG